MKTPTVPTAPGKSWDPILDELALLSAECVVHPESVTAAQLVKAEGMLTALDERSSAERNHMLELAPALLSFLAFGAVAYGAPTALMLLLYGEALGKAANPHPLWMNVVIVVGGVLLWMSASRMKHGSGPRIERFRALRDRVHEQARVIESDAVLSTEAQAIMDRNERAQDLWHHLVSRDEKLRYFHLEAMRRFASPG